MQQWEHGVFYPDLEPNKTPDLLEGIGREGWEAVGMSLTADKVG